MRPSRRSVGEILRSNRVAGSAFGAAPEVSRRLVEWLEQTYPPRCRNPLDTEREHERYAGKVELVQELRNMFDQYMDPHGAEVGHEVLVEDATGE